MAKPPDPDAEESLKRLGGGRWETRDGRFTIEPASGTWSVVDAEETDDLGLPMVRGPFRSLTDAKAAISAARETAAPASPLAGRVRDRPRTVVDQESEKVDATPSSAKSKRRPAKSGGDSADAKRTAERATSQGTKSGTRSAGPDDADAGEDREPGWLRDLSPTDRGRARRLIERLNGLGIPDADSIVRRDLIGAVPAIAAAAIERRVTALPADAGVADAVDLLVDGRDDDLGVRWRLVDGDGRPILVDVRGLRRARR